MSNSAAAIITRQEDEIAFLREQLNLATTQHEEQLAVEHDLRDQLVALNIQAGLDAAAREESKKDRKLALRVAWALLEMVKRVFSVQEEVRQAESLLKGMKK